MGLAGSRIWWQAHHGSGIVLMQIVSRFEAHLLQLLYYFLQREPLERAAPLVEQRMEPPPRLSDGCLRLVKSALSRGVTYLLASRGGWRDERHLRNGKPASGRLWHRTEPKDLGLTFTRHTLDFLTWVTSARPGDKAPAWGPSHDTLSDGDLVLLYFAHEGLRATPDSLGAPSLRRRAPFVSHGLAWLAYPEDFTQAPEGASPTFTPWMTGAGACVVEALQPELESRWAHVESSKERIEKPEAMRALGRSQERALTAFLEACEKAGRRDLARFLLRAAGRLLGPGAQADMWVGSLQMAGQRLADRSEVYNAAAALMRSLDRMAAWARWARAQGRFDDEYASAQLFLSDWEKHEGEELTARAHAIIRSLDPMRQPRT
jgi:hypothetical protein